MKHIKLFEEMENIEKKDFPFEGHDLSVRERKILTDLVGESYLKWIRIKVEDHYYYVNKHGYYLVLDSFNDLKDFILFSYHKSKYDNSKEYLELLKNSKLSQSFCNNLPIRYASSEGHTEIVKILLDDKTIDPSVDNNYCIKWAKKMGYKKIVELLINDERVRSKLSEEEINKYSR